MRNGRWWIAALLLSGAFLIGCQASQLPQNAVLSGSASLTAEANEGCLEPISADSLSQNVYDALQYEWDAWNLMSRESQMLSSHTPGYCRCDFDDWAACEEFLGRPIPNPLETCDWLEKATYVAMPLGFRDAPRVAATWYGTEDGPVEWVSVQSGYRNGHIRVTVDAALYGDSADAKPSDSGWSVELARQDYLANAGGSPLQVMSESTENYFSNTAYQACGNVLYCLHIVGEPNEQQEVERTLEQVVEAFSTEPLF